MTVDVIGRWRIVEAELWEPDDLDLVGPAIFEFADDGLGRFAFIAVEGGTDWRAARRHGRPGVEFSWEGGDDGAPASGRGWATLQADGSLCGRIFFHLGDDSAFHAVRAAEGQQDAQQAGRER
jgi:hypothetical protein